jgi:catechol 2,3-dioxygenase-like lactoylglutathione lyase family enzyme
MKKPESVLRPRINSVMPGFGVRDMGGAIDFYTTKLGFQVAFKNGAVFAIVSRDGIALSLGLDRSGSGAGKGSCYLKVEGVDAFHEEFIGKGVEMTHPLKTEAYHIREFMITDPDGNTLNFGEPVET